MNIPTDTLKSIEAIDLHSFPMSGGMSNSRSEYIKSLEEDIRLSDEAERQLRKQIDMLETELDHQSTIIDALIKAIKVIERG
jgi:hypothetical protein